MSNASGRLQGKTALITGAGSGVGYAITKLFAEQGAQVAAIARRKEHLDSWRNVNNVVPIRADITVRDDVDRMVDETEKTFGKLDIVCNIAGVHDMLNPLDETSDELWDKVINTDLRAPFQICRKAVEGMVKRGSGVILNYGSLASVRGLHGPSYCAAKAGLIGLTVSIAVCYASKGIRCNLINSGGVNTQITAHSGTELNSRGKDLFMSIAQNLPVKWVCEPEDVAPVALFLCSDESTHINGAVIPLDGGMSAC